LAYYGKIEQLTGTFEERASPQLFMFLAVGWTSDTQINHAPMERLWREWKINGIVWLRSQVDGGDLGVLKGVNRFVIPYLIITAPLLLELRTP
jgi:hypothetical protein